MAYFEEPYKKGPSKKVERQIPNTKGSYIADVENRRKEYNKGKENLNAMKESMPMSNKTIEYYNNRYEKGRTNQ